MPLTRCDLTTRRAIGSTTEVTHMWHTREIFAKQTQIRVDAKRDGRYWKAPL